MEYGKACQLVLDECRQAFGERQSSAGRKRKQEGSLATEALSSVKAEAISSVDSKKLSVTV